MENTEKQSRSGKVWTVIGAVLCVLLLPVLIINCTLLIRGYTGHGKVPSIGGVFPMIVLTDSMHGTIESGDLILCRTADPEDVRVGDIICFYDPRGNGTTTVTHRVTEITADDAGNLAWVTKGDANNTADTALVTAEDLAGVYQTRLPGVGSAALFLQSTPGLILCVGVPVLLLVGYDGVRRTIYERKNKKDTEALLAELQQLREEKASREEKNDI